MPRGRRVRAARARRGPRGRRDPGDRDAPSSAGTAAASSSAAPRRCAARPGMDFVVVTDARGIRYSHTNPARSASGVSTDPSDALAGRTVLAVETGHARAARRARRSRSAPPDGRIVGIVSVGILEGALHDEEDGLPRRDGALPGVALAVGVCASLLLARRLKRQTFGLELDELAVARAGARGDAARDPRGGRDRRPRRAAAARQRPRRAG